jgi:hypothetical protein
MPLLIGRGRCAVPKRRAARRDRLRTFGKLSDLAVARLLLQSCVSPCCRTWLATAKRAKPAKKIDDAIVARGWGTAPGRCAIISQHLDDGGRGSITRPPYLSAANHRLSKPRKPHGDADGRSHGDQQNQCPPPRRRASFPKERRSDGPWRVFRKSGV